MNIKIDEITRRQVARFVPEALQKAVDSYNGFMGREIGTEPKNFAEHHSAGKVALAHIDLILKLAKWADIDTGDMGAAAQYVLKGEAEANALRLIEFHNTAKNEE